MSIAKQITVRYRAAGHVRFAVPQEFSHPQVARQIEEGLKQAEGVYRIDLYQKQGKLSIRYIEGVTDFKAIARALFNIVTQLQMPNMPLAGSDMAQPEAEAHGAGGWAKAKYQEAKETFTAMGIVIKAASRGKPMGLTPDKEKFAMEFLTDILVLFLIRLHWHMILNEWMRKPWTYRGEWMATFYLIFLLVRSKKPK